MISNEDIFSAMGLPNQILDFQNFTVIVSNNNNVVGISRPENLTKE